MQQQPPGCYNDTVTGILDDIDRAILGLCQCGADPRPGSAYCSSDCEPTHIAADTDRRETGRFATPMRWRPDLLTAVDDAGRTLVNAFRLGRFNAQIFEYDRTDRLYLRLDDGHRFVGCDTDGYQVAAEEGLNPVWERLERELGNTAHLDEDPWSDVIWSATPEQVEAYCEAVQAASRSMVAAAERMRDAIASARPALEQLSRALNRALGQSLAAKPEAPHPMLAAIERRRDRNTGPTTRQRAPRQINPTRR